MRQSSLGCILTENLILANFNTHTVHVRNASPSDAVLITIITTLTTICYVLNPILCKDIDVLENIRKRFTRCAFYKCKLPRVSYESRLSTLNRCTCERKRLISY